MNFFWIIKVTTSIPIMLGMVFKDVKKGTGGMLFFLFYYTFFFATFTFLT